MCYYPVFFFSVDILGHLENLGQVVGVSIGFDFHNDVEFIQKELEAAHRV